MKRYICASILLLFTRIVLSSADHDLSSDPNSQRLSQIQEIEARRIVSNMIEANRYWLVSPPNTVQNYAYKFEILVTNSEPFKPVMVKIEDPSKAKFADRQGIGWYSILHRIAFDPNVLNITAIAHDSSNICIDFYLNGMPSIQCGNGMPHHGAFGSFGGDSKSDDKVTLWGDKKVFGTLWLNSENNLPEKVQFSSIIERFTEFIAVDNAHWVPLNVKVDNNFQHWDLRFSLFKPGLWLFDQSGYTLDRYAQRHGRALSVVAATNNIEINGELFSKPGPNVILSHSALQIDHAQIHRTTSELSLDHLGLVLTGRAKNDPNGLFPNSLGQLEGFESEVQEWAKNFVYVGRGKSFTGVPQKVVLVYDKSLLKDQNGTNVLFADGTVEFVTKGHLPTLGIVINREP